MRTAAIERKLSEVLRLLRNPDERAQRRARELLVETSESTRALLLDVAHAFGSTGRAMRRLEAGRYRGAAEDVKTAARKLGIELDGCPKAS